MARFISASCEDERENKMIGNIIDKRKKPYRWKEITCIFEPTWHDNSCVDADQAQKMENEGIGYEDFANINLPEAMTLAQNKSFMVTVYLYDLGEGISEKEKL